MGDTLGFMLVLVTSALIGVGCSLLLGWWGLFISMPVGFVLGFFYGLCKEF